MITVINYKTTPNDITKEYFKKFLSESQYEDLVDLQFKIARAVDNVRNFNNEFQSILLKSRTQKIITLQDREVMWQTLNSIQDLIQKYTAELNQYMAKYKELYDIATLEHSEYCMEADYTPISGDNEIKYAN